MILYKGMDAQALEAQYNLIARRGPDAAKVLERWVARSQAHCDNSRARINLAYGEGEREKLDFFSGGDSNGPVIIYIHGGYWQRGDKNMYSFVSKAFVENGVSVVILNYNLTPSVRISQMPTQIRKAIAWCWHNAENLGFSREKIFLMGHSAGGHLTAMMMATDWPQVDTALPADLLCAGIPISGLFELEPLLHTSLNEVPQMDTQEAISMSPLFIPPATDAPQLVVVGGAETPEFFRQSDSYIYKFQTTNRQMERYDVPDADHFDVVEHLAENDSVFFQKSMDLIHANS